MTDRDPYIPPGSPGYNPPGTNPPRHQLSHQDASWSATKVGGALLVIGLLAAGAFMWATNGGHDSASNPPAQTTGQGGTRVNPGPEQNAPNPIPPRKAE